MSKKFTPRPYQEEAIRAGVDFFNDTTRENGIIVAPTGSGKSLIISEIADRLDENILVFQPSKEILQQNYDKMLTYVDKEYVGIYSSSMGTGKKAHEVKKITFATIGSVKNHIDEFKHFKYVMVDESHLVSGEKGMYLNFLSMLDCKVLGLTATPFRLYSETYWEPHAKKLIAPNGQPVLDRHGNQRYEGGMRTKNAKLVMLTNDENRFFHKIVYLIQIGDLLKQGFLANIKYFDVRPDGWRDDRIFTNSEGSEFSAKSVKYMMEQTGHTEFLIRLVRRLLQPKGGRPANGILVFTQFVEDAEALCQGVADSAFVTGETTKTNRDRILKDFKEGKIKVLANVNCLSCGFDYPGLNTVILARPTMSLAMMYQQVGRVIRPYKDKEAWLIDTVGNTGRFGEVGNLYLGYSQLTNQNEFFGYVKDWRGNFQWKQLTGVYLKGEES